MIKRIKEIIANGFASKSTIKHFIGLAYLVTKFKIFIPKIKKGKYFNIYISPTSLGKSIYSDDYGLDENTNFDILFLSNFLKEGNIFIDIGANIGTLTLTASKLVGKNGKIISIEPNPFVFKWLEKNVKLNNLANIELFNTAIGKEEGEIFFQKGYSDDQLTISTNGNGTKVKITPLGNILKGYKKIDLLKVDVEGYEKFIFEGIEDKLFNKIENIYFESWENHFEKFNYTTKDILKLLQNKGFEIYSLYKKKNNILLIKLNENYLSKTCENLLATKDIDNVLKKSNIFKLY